MHMEIQNNSVYYHQILVLEFSMRCPYGFILNFKLLKKSRIIDFGFVEKMAFVLKWTHIFYMHASLIFLFRIMLNRKKPKYYWSLLL